MSYFGGLGAGKGWNTFNFILTPKELESIFKELEFSFIITNTRVAIDYKATDKPYIYKAYQHFFDEIIIGEKELDKKQHWDCESKIRISITDDLNKIHFDAITNKKGIISEDSKLVSPTEPVINIRPLYLTFLKSKESISVSYRNEEGTLGLELTYPKFVSFANDKFNAAIDAHTFSNYLLFNNLVKNIKAVSTKAKIQSSTKLYRPNFWISAAAKSVINNNRYLKSNELIIF